MQEGRVGRGENAGGTGPKVHVMTGVLVEGDILSYDQGCASR